MSTETCVHIKPDGERCRATGGIQADGKCALHSEHTAAKVAAGRRAGGAATAEQFRRPGLTEEDLPVLQTHGDAERFLEQVARAAATGQIDKGDAAAATRAVEAWLKARADKLSGNHILELELAVKQLTNERDEALRDLQRERMRVVS